MGDRPRILYVSPTMPRETGNGLAMRAATVLRALSRHCDVWLLVIPLYPDPWGHAPPASVEAACREIRVVGAPQSRGSLLSDLWRRLRPGSTAAGVDADPGTTAARAYSDREFDIVHAFRVAVLPYLGSYLDSIVGPAPRCHLDLDDIESLTFRRLARLARRNGDHDDAERFEHFARWYGSLEDEALGACERVYVCSETDRILLQGRAAADVVVLPNAVEIPNDLEPPPAGDPFRFLFIGTLGYYPNEDGMVHFASQVLPELRRMASRPFEIEVAGTGTSRRLAAIDAPEMRVTGRVPAVAPVYARSAAVIAPLRAGGGTRIKVLEAFAYRRPVVSTRAGIEGIAARDGEHVLVADSPAGFAECCARLMREPELRERLVENAHRLVNDAYSPATIDAAIESQLAPPGR
jgi:polysaccharide biosynthesis protein PslH